MFKSYTIIFIAVTRTPQSSHHWSANHVTQWTLRCTSRVAVMHERSQPAVFTPANVWLLDGLVNTVTHSKWVIIIIMMHMLKDAYMTTRRRSAARKRWQSYGKQWSRSYQKRKTWCYTFSMRLNSSLDKQLKY